MKKLFISVIAATMMIAPVASVQAAPKTPVMSAPVQIEPVQYRPGYRLVTTTEWVRGPHGRMVKREVKTWERVSQRYEHRKRWNAQKRWHRGERMDNWNSYRNVDYRSYRLSAPPRDHRWVKVDNDFLLIAIGTGLIASVVAGR